MFKVFSFCYGDPSQWDFILLYFSLSEISKALAKMPDSFTHSISTYGTFYNECHPHKL